MRVEVVYSDLDGTMVGPGGCFFRADGGALTLEPARALVDLLTAGVTLVLVSGRTRPQLIEACRVFGADGFVAELGALLGWDRGTAVELQRGAAPPGAHGVPDHLLDALFDRYRGWLEFHSPWHVGHEVDVMLRGNIPVDEAERWLAVQGYPWLALRDNGVLPPRRPTTLDPAAQPVHVYHLMPRGLSKGLAVARDLERRRLHRDQAIAIGDSASDVEMAPHVRRLHLVANGATQPHMAPVVAAHDNVVQEREPLGLGWVSAVRSALTG